MGRRSPPKVSLQAQLVAVRRAASRAALAASQAQGPLLPLSYKAKLEMKRDALVAAAMTLAAVQASREALDMMPDAQREKLSVALAAAGFRAVRVEGETEMPAGFGSESAHV